jgi:hypothetical protein
MTNLLAQPSIPIAPPGGFTGFGKLGNVGSQEEALSTFSKFISSTIGIMTIIAIIWFVFIFITGAIAWMGAGGDKNALETAKKRITTGIIGLAITIIAVFIISLIGRLLGIENILNITNLFNLVTGVSSTPPPNPHL